MATREEEYNNDDKVPPLPLVGHRGISSSSSPPPPPPLLPVDNDTIFNIIMRRCPLTLLREKHDEAVYRWAALGLTCLAWILVTISTATCSFVVDTHSAYYEKVEYGLFCFLADGEKFRYSEFDNTIVRPGTLVNAQLFSVTAGVAVSVVLLALVIRLLASNSSSNLPAPVVRQWTWTIVRTASGTALFAVILTYTMNADSFCEGTCDGSTGSMLNGFNVVVLIALMVVTSPYCITDDHGLLPTADRPVVVEDETMGRTTTTTDRSPQATNKNAADPLISTNNDEENVVLSQHLDDRDVLNSPSSLLLLSLPDNGTLTQTDSFSDNEVYVDGRTGTTEDDDADDDEAKGMQPQMMIAVKKVNMEVDLDEVTRDYDIENATRETSSPQQQLLSNHCNENKTSGIDLDEYYAVYGVNTTTQTPPPEVSSDDKNCSEEIACISNTNEGRESTTTTALALTSGLQKQPRLIIRSDNTAADAMLSIATSGNITTAQRPDVFAAPSPVVVDPSVLPEWIARLVDQAVQARVDAEMATLKAKHDGEMASVKQELTTSEAAASNDEAWESAFADPSTADTKNGSAVAESGDVLDDSDETVLASLQEKSPMIYISSASEGSSTEDDSSDELLESFVEEERTSVPMIDRINKSESTSKQVGGVRQEELLELF